ncbi:hypothetical protein A2954_02485 [Candidatus Roizmanbacteria bacterium RIFCSPLOWO2_01_FULL_37_12]|uniref:Antitoxin n=1 Tax=Candidatus Roizmanbacteria bacterium RIFCSPLOWO2_01_FULL_37_12 TaxID=1802056 RepID=A0A1F7IEW1_9BACT|nr:MAG: hypothetical protein A3D76_00075 [Candidatus Roizmanbacteria bacterium RIFCSPHIGHO2_02_FULL_37_9b]OGK41893.1 MAG: hypothetical protein A2954_02485 [Candidatus Roizmanbacteria bacterium RIFCSPLOWO2_01_FULL_37_12]
MLIDTNQIIQLTDLRTRLSEIIDAVYQGKSFIITEKGRIKAKIIPADLTEKKRKRELFKEITELRKKNDSYFKKSKGKVWNSVEVIRKMRDDRTKHFLKLAGIPFKK